MKITRIRVYRPEKPNPTFNQSDMVVTVETDSGLIGIGEGGSPDTVIQCAQMLIGEDPSRITHLWQLMYRGYFYPPGREKLHAVGALDIALWDLKGKALGAPVYELLGGLTRDCVECYSNGFPERRSVRDTARACIAAGFRAYRTAVADDGTAVFDARRMVEKTARICQEVRKGVGEAGDWAIDFHTRLDLPDSMRLCGLIEDLAPLFVEDPVRSEDPQALATLRAHTKTPIAAGEHYGDRRDCGALIEQRMVDHIRVTLPNTGGITEMRNIAAQCETRSIGLIPHFTGPIATAALVHLLCAVPVPALLEVIGSEPVPRSYLPQAVEFRNGRYFPVPRPGIGVEFEPDSATLVAEVTERSAPIPLWRRPDGSLTNW